MIIICIYSHQLRSNMFIQQVAMALITDYDCNTFIIEATGDVFGMNNFKYFFNIFVTFVRNN
jgi:hypothetical protein